MLGIIFLFIASLILNNCFADAKVSNQNPKNLVEMNEYEKIFKEFKELTKSGGINENLNNAISWVLSKVCTNIGQLSIETDDNNKELPDINELKQIVTEICNEKSEGHNAIKSSFYAKNDIGTIVEKAVKNRQHILKRMKQKEEKNELEYNNQLNEFSQFSKKFLMEFPEISKNSTVNKLMDKELVKPSDLMAFILNKLELEHFANETKLGNSPGANGGAAKKLSADAKKVSQRRQKRRGGDPIPFPLLIIAFFVFAYYTHLFTSPILFIFMAFCLFIAGLL